MSMKRRFKKGDEVICIEGADFFGDLTKGKTYIVEFDQDDYDFKRGDVRITDDADDIITYKSSRFKLKTDQTIKIPKRIMDQYNMTKGQQQDLDLVHDLYSSYRTDQSTNINKPKKPLMKKLTHGFKLLTDKGTQTLRQAGFINGDLELTHDGREALDTLVLQDKKADMVKLAEEVIKEESK